MQQRRFPNFVAFLFSDAITVFSFAVVAVPTIVGAAKLPVDKVVTIASKIHSVFFIFSTPYFLWLNCTILFFKNKYTFL